MIKHIVMWKIKDNHKGKSKTELIRRLKRDLELLKEEIPEIRYIEVGVNRSDSPAACDVVLYSEFDSMDALEVYRVHPTHQKVARFVSEISLERHVVDYEVN